MEDLTLPLAGFFAEMTGESVLASLSGAREINRHSFPEGVRHKYPSDHA